MLPIVDLVTKAVEKAPLQATHHSEILSLNLTDFGEIVKYFQSLKNNIQIDEIDYFSEALAVAIDSYSFLAAQYPEIREKDAVFQNVVLGTAMLNVAAKNLDWLLLDKDNSDNLMTHFNELVRVGYFKDIPQADGGSYLVCLQSEASSPAVAFGGLVETNDQIIAGNEKLKKVADFLKTSYVFVQGQFLVFSFSITKPGTVWPSLSYSRAILKMTKSVPDEFVGKYLAAALFAAARYAAKINEVVSSGLVRSAYLNDILFLPRPALPELPNVVAIAPEIVVEGGDYICYIGIPGYPEPEVHTIAPR